MKVSIVTIGNEILTGHTVNTNASFLAERLLSAGVIVVSCHTVGDEVDLIVRALGIAAEEADLIVVTGGLGPTSDDLTREAAAKFLGVKLQFKKDLLKKIEDFFAKRNLRMPDNSGGEITFVSHPLNKQQAYLPEGAHTIENKIGSAPGFKAEFKGKTIYVMPGVPAEMKMMFEETILPEIKRLPCAKDVIVIRKLNCFGAGESQIAEKISDMCGRERNPVINFTVNNGVVTLHITATAEDIDRAERLADEDIKLLTKRLGDLVIGTGGEGLAEVLGRLLTERKLTIAVAESCTGGLLACTLTEIPGASDYFKYGWVTYSNQAKTSELGVPAELLEQYGAVSEEAACAMAKGARKKAKADIAVAVTGIAGPTGGSEQKPVGLVYISVEMKGREECRRFIFAGDRDSIKHRAVNTALNMARLSILKFD